MVVGVILQTGAPLSATPATLVGGGGGRKVEEGKEKVKREE